MAGAAAQVKPVTLELGGKSANVVFADADLEKAAVAAPYAVFDNAGQDCTARSRILVERSVFDRFLELMEPSVKGMKVGQPAEDATEVGPLVSKAHFDSVSSFLDDDARVAYPGQRARGPGLLVRANGAHPEVAHRPPGHRRDLRADRVGAAVRR